MAVDAETRRIVESPLRSVFENPLSLSRFPRDRALGRRLPIHFREFHFSTLVLLRHVQAVYFEFGRKESRDVKQIEHLPFVFNLLSIPVTYIENYFESPRELLNRTITY